MPNLADRTRWNRVVAAPLLLAISSLMYPRFAQAQSRTVDLAAFDRERIVKAAAQCLHENPITITAASSPRSAGGLHDYFSEGDYWWPDPKNPSGPYVQRDGMSNPDNFNEHRRALMRLSVQVPALVA